LLQVAIAIGVLALVVVTPPVPLAASGQQPVPTSASRESALPSFDVVSVKMNRSNSPNQSMRLLPGGRAVVTNTPLQRLILTAYELLPQQLAGGPGWVDSDRFDVVAQANEQFEPSMPGGPPGRAQQMLQRLLAERFKLAVHTETREQPLYELATASADGRLGPRLSAAKIDCMALMIAAGRGKGTMPPPSLCGGSGGSGRISMRGAIMASFVRSLSGLTGRIVQDRTGLTGGFDFDLEFAPESGAGPDPSAPGASGASLFTALEEQLGLKLRPTRGQVQVVVIDRVEHPTED
jgi:uncharacterized protein (TIGR03435 family)